MDAAGLGVAGIDLTRAAAGSAVGGVAATVTVSPAVSDQEGTRAAGSVALSGDFGTEATFTALGGTLAYDGRTLDLATVDHTGAVTADDHLKKLMKAVVDSFGVGKKDVTAGPGGSVFTGEVPAKTSTIADAQALTP